MPRPERAYRKQHAVLWEATGNASDDGGALVSDEPEEIRVRWEDELRETLDPEGRKIVTQATVLVGRDIPIASILWLGRLADYEEDAEDNMLMEVVTKSNTPDIRNRVATRELGLLRFRGTLPEQEELE